MWKEYFINLFNNKRGSVVGTIVGLIVAVFILVIGFFKTLFLAICMFLGYYIGKKKDNNESILELIRKILPDEWK